MQKTINFSIALLLGLLIVSAPLGGSAFAQDSRNHFGNPDSWTNFFLSLFGATRLSRAEDDQLYINEAIERMFNHAVHGLRQGNEREFHRNRIALVTIAHEHGVSAPNRKVAQRLLQSLPTKYVKGYAFLRDDGTVAKDPDSFIQYSLIRAEGVIYGGSGDSGGGDD
jgi:hypothetical protein